LGVVKTAFFSIEIILGVYSIPLYIINRGKLKKIKNEILAWGGSLKKSQLLLSVKTKISMYVRFIMSKTIGLKPKFQRKFNPIF
jgi:hypothetical protein